MSGNGPIPVLEEAIEPGPQPGVVARQAPEVNPRSVIKVKNLTGLRITRPKINPFLPIPDDADGTPFVVTDASLHANTAIKHLRAQRFQEAMSEFEMASELDPRYETSLKRTRELVREIKRLGIERVKFQRVFPGQKLTYKRWQTSLKRRSTKSPPFKLKCDTHVKGTNSKICSPLASMLSTRCAQSAMKP